MFNTDNDNILKREIPKNKNMIMNEKNRKNIKKNVILIFLNL